MRRNGLLLAVVLMTATLLGVGGVALAAATPRDLPDAGTVQTDGQVSAVVVAGGRVYLGGHFTHVNGVERNRLAAIDATTGQLTDWNPNANDSVRSLAVSADGARIYAGGAFTNVGGTYRGRLAALDAATGGLDPTWKPGTANSTVHAIAVSGSRVYVGGNFTTLKEQSRGRLALVDATTGALDPDWAPSANRTVRTLAVALDGTRIYAGGDFRRVNGKPRPYLAALNPSSRALDSGWKPTTPNGKVFDLEQSGPRLYTAEGGRGGAASAYDATTGVSRWRAKGNGDVQTLAVLGGEVYLGGHFETFSGRNRHFFAALDKTRGALVPGWSPSATGNCGAWTPSTCNGFVWALSADPSAGRLYAGGNFRKVSGVSQAGFAGFSQQR
jgi:hypothetical protein